MNLQRNVSNNGWEKCSDTTRRRRSVSCVHPVAILRAVFCTICSLSMFVSDALGELTVEAYSSTGLVMALYVSSMVSLCRGEDFDYVDCLRTLVAARSMCLL